MEIQISDSPRGLSMLQIMDELSDSPGFEIYSNLIALNTSIHVLDKNFQELETFVIELTSNEKWRHLHLVENRHLLHRVSEDVVRRLHNFLAAVMSLRDHTRRLFGKYYRDGELMPDYEEMIRGAFRDDPLAQFVQKLREYCQHYRSPHMAYRTAWQDDGNQPLRTAILLKEDLDSFEGWNAQAKEFLASIDIGVDVLEVSREYRVKVMAFYE